MSGESLSNISLADSLHASSVVALIGLSDLPAPPAVTVFSFSCSSPSSSSSDSSVEDASVSSPSSDSPSAPSVTSVSSSELSLSSEDSISWSISILYSSHSSDCDCGCSCSCDSGFSCIHLYNSSAVFRTSSSVLQAATRFTQTCSSGVNWISGVFLKCRLIRSIRLNKFRFLPWVLKKSLAINWA